MKADVIALTHYHGDHIFGLPGLLQTMSCLGRTQPLFLTGPGGLTETMDPILKLTGATSFELRLMSFPRSGLCLHDLNRQWPRDAVLTAFPTRHRVVSQGYCLSLSRHGKFDPERARALGVPIAEWSRLQSGVNVLVNGRVVCPEEVLGRPRKGLKLVFSGDTEQCDALTEAAHGADLLICEATYGDLDQEALAKAHGHMTFAQAARTAQQAGVKRLWLAHYSQVIKDPQACLPVAASIYPDAVCGEDGMRMTLRFEDDEGA